VAETATGRIAEGLSGIAVVAVTELATRDLSSEEKRREAFDAIIHAAIVEGIEFTTSAVNLAIESAVAIAKDES